MVGRPQTLWSVDQATLEWNGPKCRVVGQWFLHKRAKMCNSDFLDCKLKSQKFNYRFDSTSLVYVTLWYQKKRREDRLISWHIPHLVAFRDTDLSLCPFIYAILKYNCKITYHVVVHIFWDVFLCPVPHIPVLLSFLPLSPLGTFLFGRRWTLQDGLGISQVRDTRDDGELSLPPRL